MKDYYKILGVTETASLEEIKGAYRKLAKQYHPDVVKGDKEKENHMYEIQEAYACLGEEKRRRDDDRKRQKTDGNVVREEKKQSSYSVRPDKNPFEQFFGFQPGRGMETYHHNKRENQMSGGPVKPEEMFEFFLRGQRRNGGRQ